MLSCSPAQAARRSERRSRGSRASSAPTCRRNARICGRVRSSRVLVMSPSPRRMFPGSIGELAAVTRAADTVVDLLCAGRGLYLKALVLLRQRRKVLAAGLVGADPHGG